MQTQETDKTRSAYSIGLLDLPKVVITLTMPCNIVPIKLYRCKNIKSDVEIYQEATITSKK